MAIQQFTVRSISLPSRLHPNGLKIEAELNNLKQWEASSSIEAGLVHLAELYNSTREALESSSTQAALLQHQNGIHVEESIDGSIELLDSCGAIKDLFLTMKEHVQELQSALRRKNGDSRLSSDINAFISFRRRVKKEAEKSLRKLKHMESKVELVPCLLLDMDHNLASVVKMLREVSAITISILRSLLVFLSNSLGSSTSRWSLISKMVTTKSHKGHTLSDLGFVDLNNGKSKDEAQMVRGQLQILDGRIEGLEAGLECLFRQLVRHRVTLLNILTH